LRFGPNSFRNSFRNNTRKLGKSRQQREILLLRQEEWSRSKFNKNFRRDVLNPDMRATHSMRENLPDLGQSQVWEWVEKLIKEHRESKLYCDKEDYK
jgi:hypothetical protein